MNIDFTFSPDLDSETITTYLGDDLDYIRTIFNLFLEQTPKEMENIRSLTANGNWEEAGKIAHKIKPTFIMVGFPKYETLLKDFELTAKGSSDPKELKEILAKLEEAVEFSVKTVQADYSRLNDTLGNES
ncbi:MAG: hypothetical protein SchgKO_17440 [Schleiferiaceae bacterium]